MNEVNAAGGRIVTSPTNGASGVIPAVLKYIVEVGNAVVICASFTNIREQFISEDPEKDIATFLLTSAAIGSVEARMRLT